WIGNRIERTGVLDDAADVVQGVVRQTGVAIASKQVLAVLPDRLVYMHSRTVVACVRLGHEGSGFAVGVGNVMNDVLLQHRPVGALHQSAETCANLVLTSTSDFMVEHF